MARQSKSGFKKEHLSSLAGQEARCAPAGLDHYPGFIRKAFRSKIIIKDNDKLTDYDLGLGAHPFGHAHRNVVLAVKKIAERGIGFNWLSRPSIEYAGFLSNTVPCFKEVCFLPSHQVARHMACEICRHVTKRPFIIDVTEAAYYRNPLNHFLDTIPVLYNQIDIVKEKIEQNEGSIACVICEPVSTQCGIILPQEGFLQSIRNITKEKEIPLIFDEAVTGFWGGPGGVEREYDVTPDLAIFAGMAGGGFPLGILGGDKNLMSNVLSVAGQYYRDIAFPNPVILSAGMATLKLLHQRFLHTFDKRCDEFVETMNQFFLEENIEAHIEHYHALMSLRLTKNKVVTSLDAQKALDQKITKDLLCHLLRGGIYWPQDQYKPFVLSGVHSRQEILQLIHQLKDFFKN